jgi:hypothetical protein
VLRARKLSDALRSLPSRPDPRASRTDAPNTEDCIASAVAALALQTFPHPSRSWSSRDSWVFQRPASVDSQRPDTANSPRRIRRQLSRTNHSSPEASFEAEHFAGDDRCPGGHRAGGQQSARSTVPMQPDPWRRQSRLNERTAEGGALHELQDPSLPTGNPSPSFLRNGTSSRYGA